MIIWSKFYFESIINSVWNMFTCKFYVSVWDKNWLPIYFSKKFFFKVPSFWVFTQASGKYLGKYPKNIYLPTGYLPTPHHYTYITLSTVHAMSVINNIYQCQVIWRTFTRVTVCTDGQTDKSNAYTLFNFNGKF